MTSCAMPKTEPVGLTFVQLTDDDNDDDDNDDDDDDNDDDDDDDARNSNIIEQIHIMCFTVVGSWNIAFSPLQTNSSETI